MSRSAFTALLLSCVLLALSMPARADDLPYRFGLGKADITGEAAEVGMMGYPPSNRRPPASTCASGRVPS